MLVIALIAIILSVGVINAFIPIIIIIILIAAGAGAMRGFNLFNAFGVATLVGGGPGTVGGSTRGTIAKSGFPLRAFLDAPTVKRPQKFTPLQERKNFGSPLGPGKKSQKLGGGKPEGQEGGSKKAETLEAAFIEHLDTMHRNAEAEAEELKRRGGMVRLASARPTGSAASSPFTNPGAKEKAAYDSYAGTKTTPGTKTKAAQMAFAGFGGERAALLASIKKSRGREREVLLSKLKEARVSNSDQRKTRIDANNKAMQRSMKQMMVIARRRVEFGINGPKKDKLSGGEINALINMGLRNEGDRTTALSESERNAFARRTQHDIDTLQAQKKIIDNYFNKERTAKSAYQRWSSENAILGLHGYDRMRLDRIDEERKKAAKVKRRKDWRRENIYNPIARSMGKKPKDGQ